MVGDSAHTNEVLSVVSPPAYLTLLPQTAGVPLPFLPSLLFDLLVALYGAGNSASKSPIIGHNKLSPVLLFKSCSDVFKPALRSLEDFAALCTDIQMLSLSTMQFGNVQDFHGSDGNRLLSAGMDHSIKMWNLAGAPSPTCHCIAMHHCAFAAAAYRTVSVSRKGPNNLHDHHTSSCSIEGIYLNACNSLTVPCIALADSLAAYCCTQLRVHPKATRRSQAAVTVGAVAAVTVLLLLLPCVPFCRAGQPD